VLASASADTAIDWRVDSAWLLAASSLVSASVRLDEAGLQHVDQVLGEVLAVLHDRQVRTKRRCFRPQRAAGVFSEVRALLAELLSRKSVPAVNLDRLSRDVEVTPGSFTSRYRRRTGYRSPRPAHRSTHETPAGQSQSLSRGQFGCEKDFERADQLLADATELLRNARETLGDDHSYDQLLEAMKVALREATTAVRARAENVRQKSSSVD